MNITPAALSRNREIFQEIVRSHLKKDSDYQQALPLANKNRSGKDLWLIGGGVYRPIISKLYETNLPTTDFDFIVKAFRKVLFIPSDWYFEFNSHKNPRFSFIPKNLSQPKFHVDIFQLGDYGPIKQGLPKTIESYLSSVPMTIQSIAFYIPTQTLLGQVGVESILSRTVEVNNLESMERLSESQNLSIEELLKRKANQIGFSYVLPKL